MQQQSYLSRKIQFRIFNRKEIQKNKMLACLEKCEVMDAYDNDMEFWKLMRSNLQPSRGVFSRNTPKTPQLWGIASEGEAFSKYGNLEKRKISDILDDMRKLSDGTGSNGGINLKAIDWTPKQELEAEWRRQQEAEMMAEQEAIEAQLRELELQQIKEEQAAAAQSSKHANSKSIPIEGRQKSKSSKHSMTVKK